MFVALVSVFVTREGDRAAHAANPTARTAVLVTRIRFATTREPYAVARARCAGVLIAVPASCAGKRLAAQPNAAAQIGRRPSLLDFYPSNRME